MNMNSHESSDRGCVRSTSRSTRTNPNASDSLRSLPKKSAAAGTSSTTALQFARRDFARRSRETCINEGICRGFDVQVAALMEATIADGLKKTGGECVDGCPAGALVRLK